MKIFASVYGDIDLHKSQLAGCADPQVKVTEVVRVLEEIWLRAAA